MFNPPEELHRQYEDALKKVKAQLGKNYGLIINGRERYSAEVFENRNPANTDEVLGVFQKGTRQDVEDAVQSAKTAQIKWKRIPWQERVAIIRKAADNIDKRIYELAVALSLEVGKNRMEALGDAAESADLMRYACDQMEANDGFIHRMGKDPLAGYDATNISMMLPYGVWLVISPFNFPCALTGGPAGAALVTGNSVIIKPASDTPWAPRIYVECLLEAGVPEGVVNYITGSGSEVGQTLVEHPFIDGITFTGSYDVGMRIYRSFSQWIYIRPVIMELGGKNAAIVSKNADLETAAIGIMRSAFGLQGQKCSACSRVFIEEEVYDDLVNLLVTLAEKITVGDPTRREIYMGPVINRNSYQDYQNYIDDLRKSGRILTGAKVFTEGDYAKGFFCAPTFVADLPLTHPLWQQEMFLPITTIAKVDSLDQAMTYTNQVKYGLTGGFYGTEEEAAWFFDNIEAGVVYANRPQGATTGAWPGFQPFGGWKASGATGKQAGGLNYLQQYMREQSRTLIRRIS